MNIMDWIFPVRGNSVQQNKTRSLKLIFLRPFFLNPVDRKTWRRRIGCVIEGDDYGVRKKYYDRQWLLKANKKKVMQNYIQHSALPIISEIFIENSTSLEYSWVGACKAVLLHQYNGFWISLLFLFSSSSLIGRK
jgi:hypothetical protein